MKIDKSGTQTGFFSENSQSVAMLTITKGHSGPVMSMLSPFDAEGVLADLHDAQFEAHKNPHSKKVTLTSRNPEQDFGRALNTLLEKGHVEPSFASVVKDELQGALARTGTISSEQGQGRER